MLSRQDCANASSSLNCSSLIERFAAATHMQKSNSVMSADLVSCRSNNSDGTDGISYMVTQKSHSGMIKPLSSNDTLSALDGSEIVERHNLRRFAIEPKLFPACYDFFVGPSP